jgi:hypothetical protein
MRLQTHLFLWVLGIPIKCPSKNKIYDKKSNDYIGVDDPDVYAFTGSNYRYK